MTPMVLAAKLPADIEVRLFDRYAVRRLLLGELGLDAFIAGLGEPKVLIVAIGNRINADLIARLPSSVMLLANFGAGIDHIDVAAAAMRGISVTNTPDVLTNATADIAMLLILGAMRGAAPAERMLRAGEWRGWSPDAVFGTDLAGKTLGIWGFGRIGRATAKRARAFGMRIAYHGRNPHPRAAELDARFVADRQEFLGTVDAVSLHMPISAETHRILDAEAIAALRPGVVIINTARGELIAEDALIAALESGHVGAVGLDVYENEPRIDRRWLSAPRTFLLPHIGSATVETRTAMGTRMIANIDAFLAGKLPGDRVGKL